MNLRRIKHTLLRMSTEEKVIGIGALAIFFGSFMPWYSVVMNFDKKAITETGFSGDLGVIGFVIFLLSLLSILMLVAENMHLPLPRFGYKREQIIFFFLAESFFLTLLTMAVYTKRSLDFTDAGLRFGIYLVLLGAFFGGLSAFALIQKTKKQEVSEFFSHEQEEEREEPSETPDGDELERRVPEQMYFEQDVQPLEVIEEKEEIEKTPEPPKIKANQMDYFKREAGVEKPAPTEENPKPRTGPSMGFYEDK